MKELLTMIKKKYQRQIDNDITAITKIVKEVTGDKVEAYYEGGALESVANILVNTVANVYKELGGSINE